MAEDPFDFEPRSGKEEAELKTARAARGRQYAEQRRAEGAVRRSNRAVGALVLIPALGLIAASVFLHNPHFPWESTIGSTTAMALRVGGILLGLQGLRMLVFGSRE